jgi:YidC/Oxa1 family membrane protein insertase
MAYRGGPEPQDTRNVFLAIGLSLAIFLGFEFFYNAPQRERQLAEQALIEQQQAETQAAARAANPDSAEGADPAPPAAGPVTRDQAIAAAAESGGRVVIQTPSVDGAISLDGARFDDLSLAGYNRQLDPASGEVTLLSPINSEYGHDAFFGWELQTGSDTSTLAGADTRWTAPDGARLTPATPVTLTHVAENGVTLERTISIDEHYMFTITDVVRNPGGAAISVRPFGTVRRQGMPADYRQNPIVHQGLIGVFGDTYRQTSFQNADKHARNKQRGRAGADERIEEEQAQGGWFGITEHYWLAAIVPDQSERISAYFDSRPEDNRNDYRAAYRGQWREAAAGGDITYTQRFYAGAKEVELLQGYQDSEQSPIPRFDDAIDWGNFWFLTRPFFLWLLHPLGQLVGNFGIAILLSTIVIKAILFPLVYQSFKAMAKMRALQPKMKELQERYAADKQRQQQELLKLYQTEKINPVAGCVPILLQIPVFFALYKTLTVTIEMRHAPFFGWIQDLSARDPTSLFNRGGLVPFDPGAIPFIGSFLLIGAWPIFYGVSMWALQQLSPPPTDPIQKQIFGILPFVFTILFASFAAGLVIYWTWSNVLSILQQYVIMRRQGVETQLDTFLKKRFGKEKSEPASS